ncbi:MAG: flagellar hook-basal body complex protein FliE [Pseudomonadales bacterium]|nr:flagellar hook-basal body complex protein FliE [Pseudomonadales bacterium]
MDVGRVDVNQVLSQMRNMRAEMPNATHGIDQVNGNSGISKLQGLEGTQETGFGEMLSNSINAVNELSDQSTQLSSAYSQGDPNVDITQVMVAMQKSKISFEAVTQVRNKLVTAYKDIMNMPV